MVQVHTVQAETLLTPQDSMVQVHTVQAKTLLTPQDSMLEVHTVQADTLLTPQDSMGKVHTVQAETLLTPQDSMVEVHTVQAETLVTPQDSVAEVHTLQAEALPIPHSSVVLLSTPQTMTPRKSQDSMIQLIRNQLVMPVEPQNSVVEVSAPEAVTCLSPQNSVFECGTESVFPVTPRNLVLEEKTPQVIIPISAQNPLEEVKSAKASTPLTPESSKLKINKTHGEVPRTQQHSVVESRNAEVPKLQTSQNFMVDVFSVQPVISQTQVNLTADVSNSYGVTPLLPASSRVTPLTSQNFIMEGNCSTSVTPHTPQRTMVEVRSTPVAPQNTISEVSTPISVTHIAPQNFMEKVSTDKVETASAPKSSTVEVNNPPVTTHPTPQNFIEEVSTSQALTLVPSEASVLAASEIHRMACLSPLTSRVEDISTHTVTHVTQKNVMEVDNEGATPLPPKRCMEEVNIPEAVSPFIPQSSVGEIKVTHSVATAAPQSSVVEFSSIQALTPLTPQNTAKELNDTQPMIPLVSHSSMVEVCTLQAEASSIPQNATFRARTFEALTQQTPLNSTLEVSVPEEVFPLTQHAPLVELNTVARVTPVTPVMEVYTSEALTHMNMQKSMLGVCKTTEETPLMPQNSMMGMNAAQTKIHLTPQNSIMKVTPESAIHSTPWESLAETKSSQAVTPVTPQNCIKNNTTHIVVAQAHPPVDEVNSSKALTPLTAYNSMDEVGSGRSVSSISQNARDETSTTQVLTPLTPQNFAMEVIMPQELIITLPHDIKQDSTPQIVKVKSHEAFTPTAQMSEVEVNTSSAVIPPIPYGSVLEVNITEAETSLIPKQFMTEISTPLTSLSNMVGVSVIQTENLVTPQKTMVKVENTEADTSLMPQSSVSDKNRTPSTTSFSPQNSLVDLNAIQGIPVKTDYPQDVTSLTTENSMMKIITSQALPSQTPQSSGVEVSTYQTKTLVMPQVSLAEVSNCESVTSLTTNTSMMEVSSKTLALPTPHISIMEVNTSQGVTPQTQQDAVVEVSSPQTITSHTQQNFQVDFGAPQPLTLSMPQNSLAEVSTFHPGTQSTPSDTVEFIPQAVVSAAPQNFMVEAYNYQAPVPLTPQDLKLDATVSPDLSLESSPDLGVKVSGPVMVRPLQPQNFMIGINDPKAVTSLASQNFSDEVNTEPLAQKLQNAMEKISNPQDIFPVTPVKLMVGDIINSQETAPVTTDSCMVAVSDMHTVPSLQLENPMVDSVFHSLQDSMAAVHGSQLVSGSRPLNSTVESDGSQAIPSPTQTPGMEAPYIPCSFIPHIYQSSTAKVNSLDPTVRQVSRQEMKPLKLSVSFDLTPLATSTPVGSNSFLMDGSKVALSTFVTSPINTVENSSGKDTCIITKETCGIPHSAHDSVHPRPSLYTSENIMGAVECIRVQDECVDNNIIRDNVCTFTEPEQSSTVERIAPTIFSNLARVQCSVLPVDFDTPEQMRNTPALHPDLQSEVYNTTLASCNVIRDGNQYPPEVRGRTGYSSLEDKPHTNSQISETGHELQSDVNLGIGTTDLHLLSSDIHEKYNTSKELTLGTCLVDSTGFTEQHNSESYTAPLALQNEGAQFESIPTTVPTITAHSHSDVLRSFVSSSSPLCKGGILKSCKPGVETGSTLPLASLKTSVSEEESPAPIHLVPTLCSEEMGDSQIPPEQLTKLTAALEAKLEVSPSKGFPPSKLQEKSDDISQHQRYATCTSNTNERDYFYAESGVESEDVSLAEDALLTCDSVSMVVVGQLNEEQMTVCKEGLDRQLLSDVGVMRDDMCITGNPELNVHMNRTIDNMPSLKEQMSGNIVIAQGNGSTIQNKTSKLAKSAVPSLEYNVVADSNKSDLTEENTVLSSCDVPRVTLNQEGMLDTDSNGEEIDGRNWMDDERSDTGFGQVDISLKSAQPGKASLPCGTEGQSDVGTNITGQGALAGLSSVDDSVQSTTEDTTTYSKDNAVTYISNLHGRRDVKIPLSDSKQTPGDHLVAKTSANIGLDDCIIDEKNVKDIVTKGGETNVSEDSEDNQTLKNTTQKELVNLKYTKDTIHLTTQNTILDHKVDIALDDREDRQSQLSSSNIFAYKPSDKLMKPGSRILYSRSNIIGFAEQSQTLEDLQISSEEKSISPRESNEESLQSGEIGKVLNYPTSRIVTTTRAQEKVGSLDQHAGEILLQTRSGILKDSQTMMIGNTSHMQVPSTSKHDAASIKRQLYSRKYTAKTTKSDSDSAVRASDPKLPLDMKDSPLEATEEMNFLQASRSCTEINPNTHDITMERQSNMESFLASQPIISGSCAATQKYFHGDTASALEKNEHYSDLTNRGKNFVDELQNTQKEEQVPTNQNFAKSVVSARVPVACKGNERVTSFPKETTNMSHDQSQEGSVGYCRSYLHTHINDDFPEAAVDKTCSVKSHNTYIHPVQPVAEKRKWFRNNLSSRECEVSRQTAKNLEVIDSDIPYQNLPKDSQVQSTSAQDAPTTLEMSLGSIAGMQEDQKESMNMLESHSSLGSAEVEVIVSDYSSKTPEESLNTLQNQARTETKAQNQTASLSTGYKDKKESKQIEKLTSASWQGNFLMEHDCTSDEWGASDESITFIFMNPGEGEQSPTKVLQETVGHSSSSNYRSSSDLSQVGLSIGIPNELHRTHSYDLYKTTCGRLIRTTSLDSISTTLRKFRIARLKTTLTRTCSLEEEVNQEMEGILERGRLFSSDESVTECVRAKDTSTAKVTHLQLHDGLNKDSVIKEEYTNMVSHRPEFNTDSQTVSSDGSEDDVFTKSPSPVLTFGQTSWFDFKSLILGHPLPPSSVRGIAGESSKSSPQLHRRQNNESLSKKSVSWTDLKGCGALEMEVSEDIRTQECVRPVLHLKSIMKKPSLSPIAPTPPPPTPPTPPCSTLPHPTSPPVISPQPSHIACDDTSVGAESSEDDIPLPRSNLKELFSLQLPQHIHGHGNRSSTPPNDAPNDSSIGKPLDDETHTGDISTLEVLEISQPFTTTKTPSFSSTLSVSKTLSFSSTLVDKKTSEASTSSFSKPYRVSLSLGNSLSTEDNSSSGFSQYSDVSASSNISLCSGVSPNSRATSSSGVSCSGFSSSGAVSSPGGVSPLHDSSAAAGVIPSCEILQSNNTAMLSHITSSPVSNLNMSARKQKSHNIYVSSSVHSTPAETMQVAPSSNSTFSAPATPSGEAAPSSLASVMKQNISRCRSEGDLVMPSVVGISDTWTALSKVMQEAGTILKTLSETSQVLHQKIVSPHHKASLAPVIEEGTGNSSIVGTTSGRKVSVAVQTDHQHHSNIKTRSMDAQTSFESTSDSDNGDVRSKLSQSHYPFTSTESTCKPDIPEALNSETVTSPGFKGLSVLHEIKSLRQERERINRLLGQYEFSSLHPSRNGSRVRGKSSSSDFDSPVSSLMASLQNLTQTQHEREVESEAGSYWHNLSATSKRYLAMYQRRLEDSCYQLEERLRLSARRRQLRKQMISNNHNHYPSIQDRLALHASLDFAKNPFCGQMQSPSATPYMSTASLPTVAPQSPHHSREASPCCCISPTHRPHHNHCQSPASSCSAHTHWASCHAAPAQDLSYTPHCMNSRVRISTQQCREQLLNLRRHLVSASGLASSSSSLGDTSPGRHSCRFKNIGNSFDTPYQRRHAASLSSLSRVNSISGLWRHGVSGSTASVASESEADKRRSRRRVDSDSDSGAGWSSSGTSLRHAYH